MNTTTNARRLQQPRERSEQGLVSFQQSFGASTSGKGAIAGTAPAVGKHAPIHDRNTKRYRVKVTNGTDQLVIHTHLGRLLRCQRRIHAWADALPRLPRRMRRWADAKHAGPRMVMVTLTYRDADAWEALQIRDFMTQLRLLLGEQLLAYAWVMEMQERGAPHYHILLYVERGTDIPKPDESLWKYGSSKIETAKTAFYIVKYTSQWHHKAYQKEGFPYGARMFAVAIYASNIADIDIFNFRSSTAPNWFRDTLKELFAVYGKDLLWKRCRGGGYIVQNTGELFSSPWSLLSVERIE